MKKIEVFLRHCYYSKIQEAPGKQRPEWWNKEKVFQNFKNTLNPETTNYTIVYDKHYGERKDTFLKDEQNVYEIDCGKESQSFIHTLNYVLSQDLDDATIVYFLEDDYVHRPVWDKILIDGFSLPVDYVTLYDHGDKYQEMYKDFMTKVLHTKFSHWMPVPSTTNTFAAKFKTLKEDKNTHIKYSLSYEPTYDHGKFLELHSNRRTLISCIPGYSTHCESNLLSPCIDWKNYL
jgi:hypothetical protein